MSALHVIGIAMHRLNYKHTRKQSILSNECLNTKTHCVGIFQIITP